MLKHSLISAFLLAGLAETATAAELDYTTLDLGYQRYELDEDGADFHTSGINLAGSLQLNEDFFLRGGYEDVDGSEGPFSLDARTYSLGLGVRAPINSALDFNAYADYLNTRVQARADGLFSESDTDDGYRLGAGLRGLATSNLELAGFVSYEDYQDGDSTKWLDGRAVYKVTENLGVYAGYGWDLEDSDIRRWNTGVRISF